MEPDFRLSAPLEKPDTLEDLSMTMKQCWFPYVLVLCLLLISLPAAAG